MVAPLLAAPFIAAMGGLGLAALAKPHLDNRTDRVRGRYRDSLLDPLGTDPSIQDQRNALFRGNLLDPADFISGQQTAFDNMQDRIAAMERQQVASGPGYLNAGLARDQWQANPGNPQSPQYTPPTPGYGQPYDPQLDPQVVAENATRSPGAPPEPPANLIEQRLIAQVSSHMGDGIAEMAQTVRNNSARWAQMYNSNDPQFIAQKNDFQQRYLDYVQRARDMGAIGDEEYTRAIREAGAPDFWTRPEVVWNTLDRLNVRVRNRQAEAINVIDAFNPAYYGFRNRYIGSPVQPLGPSPFQAQNPSSVPGGPAKDQTLSGESRSQRMERTFEENISP